MEFDLTPEITDEIIFAMEDQNGLFLYDSAECRCVDGASVGAGKPGEDENADRFFAIPQWDSVSGFRMMDRFVAQLRNPLVREELRSALTSGRGVFRAFKNALKTHAEIERLWFQFKEREMRRIVLEWYNGLRDYWGLEHVGPEPEETAEIVAQDFHFRELAADDDEIGLSALMDSIELEIAESQPVALGDAISELSERVVGADGENEFRLAAENMDGELVAVAISTPIPEGSFLSAQITALAVYPEFRGLGIGKELLARTTEYWSQRGYRWLVFAAPTIPSAFLPALRRAGFVSLGHASVLDLSVGTCH